MREILERAVSSKNESNLPDLGRPSLGDLTGMCIRNIVNNICQNDIRYLEIGLYRGGIFSAALYGNSIRAVGIDNWSQNWMTDDSRKVFFDRLEETKGNNSVDIIESDCWVPSLLREKFNVYTFDGPHGWQDQYDALVKYIDHMDNCFIYIVDDYDRIKSPEVVDAVQSSIKNLNLKILLEYEFPAGNGFHEGIYMACLEKQ
jgi:hypothetical protein